jgi:hypothetical protein
VKPSDALEAATDFAPSNHSPNKEEGETNEMALRNQARTVGLVSLLLPAMLLAYGLLGGASQASAALPAPSIGIIGILGPQSVSGPVDTLVTLEVREYASNSPTYILATTTTSPDQGGCTTAKPLSGVQPFQLGPSVPIDVQFHWPAGLGRGRYWFCASPASGTGPTAMSLASQPFTVLTDAAPTVQITPAGSIQAGTQVTVTVSNWLTSDTASPFELLLLKQGGSAQTASPVAAQVEQGQSSPTTGAYVMTATLPSYVASGTYALVAQGECGPDPLGTSKAANAVCAVSEQSPFFTLTAAPAPTATKATANPPGSTTGHGGPTSINALWLVAAAGILVLGLLGLGIALALARRAGAASASQRQAYYRGDGRSWDDPRSAPGFSARSQDPRPQGRSC